MCITHARIEHGYYFGVTRHAGRKEDNSNQRKDRPQQSVDVRNKIEVIIEQDFLLGDRLINKLFNVFAEIDGDGNNREQQRGKKKRAQVFAYDISVERKQVYT